MADEDKKAAQYRKEAAAAQSSVPTPAERAEIERAKQESNREKAEKAAPTTRTTMGDKPFKKGGSVRGGGIESKGKTKGRML
jgi:hypothetical protein